MDLLMLLLCVMAICAIAVLYPQGIPPELKDKLFSNDVLSLLSTRREKIKDRFLDPQKLDLHFLRTEDAVTTFRKFLSETENKNNSNKKEKMAFVDVITGRGLHSDGGVPKIKMEVQRYINERGFRHEWKNPGMVRIFLSDVIKNAAPGDCRRTE